MRRRTSRGRIALSGLITLIVGSPALAQCGEAATDSPCAPRTIPGTQGVYEVVMDVTAATPEFAMNCGFNAGHTVWFTISPVSDGTIVFSTCHPATTYDTIVQVWEATGDCEFPIRLDSLCVDDTSSPDCDNGCSAFGSTVTIPAVSGQTYLVQVGSYNDNGAGCDLCLGVRVAVCAGDPTPPIVDLTAPAALACACHTVDLVGSAYDPDGAFDRWTMSYRPATGGPWTVIGSDVIEVVGDTFFTWSTGGLVEGYYQLRLVGRNACGLTTEDVEVVFVDQAFTSLDLHAPNVGDILGGTVCFDCIAWDQCFDQYTVEYRPVGAGSFLPVDPMMPIYTTPQQNVLCATWDTTVVPDGLYEVRLAGETICGDGASLTLPVTVDNTAPTADIELPPACEAAALPGEIIAVTGTALDANLQGWTLEYAGGGTGGWTPLATGNTSLVDELLHDWDTTGLDPCCYALRLVVTDGATVDCNGAVHHRTETVVTVSIGCPGDVNHDGAVDVTDLVTVILEWGGCIPTATERDRMIEVLRHLGAEPEALRAGGGGR